MPSLSELIAGKFERNINEGIWTAGENIPSCRVLADREEVSRGVINDAIKALIDKGYLVRTSNHGIKVSEQFKKNNDDIVLEMSESEFISKKDAGLAREYAMRCMNIINERRQDNNNILTDEDLEMLHQCFGEVFNSRISTNNVDSSGYDNFSEMDKTLYSKGLRCAGWPPEKYTLYRCNLTSDEADLVKGTLLSFAFEERNKTFDDRTMDYVEKRVHPNDASNYLSYMKRKKFMAEVEDGEKDYTFEYRERKDDSYRWNRASINVSKDDKGDVILFILYLDIDTDKKKEILQKELSEEDALTGALNRRAFILQSEQILAKSDKDIQHAFLMLDVDGFKAVNDLFGHPVGDTVLSDLTKIIRSVLRQGDILGRIGGDEFMICMTNIPFNAIIEKRANQICSLVRRKFDNGISISGSIGVAVYPRDGESFSNLYQKADIALYNAKDNGKDRVIFYSEGMQRNDYLKDDEEDEAEKNAIISIDTSTTVASRKKILIVDDNDQNRENIAGILSDDYIVLQTKDGKNAIMTLKRFSSNVAAVILSLNLIGMDGMSVLKSIQNDSTLKTIPVIVFSDIMNDDNEYKAIEMGAIEYLRKPIDTRLLKLRVKNAVNKKENERLRIQNSYFQYQEDEEAKYRFVVESSGLLVIEHDWVNSVFVYDKMLSQVLSGRYDHRSFWRILLSDMVASSMTVKDMQGVIYRIANDRKVIKDSLLVQLKNRNGDKHWFEMSVYKQSDGLQITNKLLITLKDIDEQVLSQEKLKNMAEYDSLTRLCNRSTFLTKADEMIKQCKPSAWELCIVDIDGFKVFNHIYGHNGGDMLLTFIAGVLKTVCAKNSGLCGRVQSDVFAFLLPTKNNGVEKTLTELMQAIDTYSDGRKITTCAGRYIVSEPTLTINAILDRAVIAHGIAKSKKIISVMFTSDMQNRLLKDQEITSSMEAALKDDQFVVYFQPIYDYESGKIITAEALVRWVHPERGIIPPNDFVPLFEQNGFIFNMDFFVWDRTCSYVKRWINMGIDIMPISVNVSRVDIYEPNFVSKLVAIIKKYDIQASLLRLEITEGAYIDSPDYIIEIVEQLKDLGFMVEMDDFGSGYSSLNILSEVPVDILKLDMRFIAGENRTGKKDKIMGHIISMAKSTDIDVIAEGVETFEQAEMLKSLGCNTMQGYYFSKPISMEEFEKLLVGRI